MLIGPVVLGSTSPAKLLALKEALREVHRQSHGESKRKMRGLPQPRADSEARFEVLSFSAPSGVPAQPWGEAQTREGAFNRAVAALEGTPSATLAVGIEAGVAEEPGWPLWTFAWVVALDTEGVMGAARSATFAVPEALAAGVRGGLELGEALDKAYGLQRAKDGPGAVGVLTSGLVDRPELYRVAVLLALTPWLSDSANLGT